MARLLSILAGGFVALAIALAPGSAGAEPGNGNGQGNGPPFDIVRGQGTFQAFLPFTGILDVTVTVDGMTKKGVTSGTYSADIRVSRFNLTIQVSGHLTCLRVDGNQTVISGAVEQTNQPGFAPLGSGVIAMGVDNGEPGPDGTPVDTVFALPEGRPLTHCPEAVSAGSQLLSGDFVTHDGDWKNPPAVSAG
jgi:hypothetical protein